MSNQLINKSAVREYTLAMLRANRPHLADKMTRVSPEYFDRVEAKLKATIMNEVASMPTSGATIK